MFRYMGSVPACPFALRDEEERWIELPDWPFVRILDWGHSFVTAVIFVAADARPGGVIIFAAGGSGRRNDIEEIRKLASDP
jgi:hypothetical protein